MAHRGSVGRVRLLALLLLVWEPIGAAVAVAGAMNALAVRGMAVGLVAGARVLGAGLAVAAGRALLNGRSVGRQLAALALTVSGAVQLFAVTTRYFPSNSMPGDAPLYVAALVIYYGGWLAYVARSKRLRTLSA